MLFFVRALATIVIIVFVAVTVIGYWYCYRHDYYCGSLVISDVVTIALLILVAVAIYDVISIVSVLVEFS